MDSSPLSKDAQNWDSNWDGLGLVDPCCFLLISIHISSSGDDIVIGLFEGPTFPHIVLPSGDL